MKISAKIGSIAAAACLPVALSMAQGPHPDDEFTFDGPVFDIAATPSGSILVADFATVREIGTSFIRDLITLPIAEGEGAFETPAITFINGLAPRANGNFYAARSGLDLAVGAALFEARPGSARTSRSCILRGHLGIPCTIDETVMVADIEAFTVGAWPVNAAGQKPGWKNSDCEIPGGFSSGPQTNPYHIATIANDEVLIADAAGNTLLLAKQDGIELVATFDPVMDSTTGEGKILFPLNDDTNCFVEPVPTSIAIGSDGAFYVGELNGSMPENFPGESESGEFIPGEPTPEGLASVWRIEPDARNARCPSEQCTKVVTGLNSVIDIDFGPDGQLYVVEFEQNGFLAAAAPDFGIPLAGGSVKRCDVTADSCDVIAGGDGTLFLPGAITFDGAGNLWLLDNVFAPTVRAIDWQ